MVITPSKQKARLSSQSLRVPKHETLMKAISASALPTEAAGRGALGRLRAYEDGLEMSG